MLFAAVMFFFQYSDRGTHGAVIFINHFLRCADGTSIRGGVGLKKVMLCSSQDFPVSPVFFVHCRGRVLRTETPEGWL